MRKKLLQTFSQMYIFGHILIHVYSNILCNGDFQAYKTTTTVTASDGTSVTYVMIPQNYSCWYRLPHGDIQVQNQSYGYYTRNIELSDFWMQPYALCQNFSTKINSNYSLSLDFFTPKQITSSTAYVYLNNILIASGTSVGYLTPMKLTYNFTSMIVTYMVCINGTIVKNSNTPIFADYSPMIDNVTVIQIISNIANTSTTNNNTANPTNIIINTTTSNTTTTNITNSNTSVTTNNSINTTNNTSINITINSTSTNPSSNTSTTINNQNITPSLPPPNITNTINSTVNNTSPVISISSIYFQLNLLMTTNDEEGYIQFQSEIFVPYQIFLVFQSSSTIFISGEVQNQVTYFYNENGTVQAKIYVQRAYFLRDIQFQIPEEYISSNTKVNIVVYINGRPIYIYFGTKNSIKSIQNVELISQNLVNGISKGYDLMKACFCSYFVINIINFYSLTLFYNFLAIKSQPTFSHNSLQKISQIFYVRNSLIGYFSRQFNLTTLDISNAQFLTGDEQIIDQFYREYIWFGGMGIQDDFFRNNLESIILIILAVFKLLMIKFFFKAFPNLMKFFFGNFQGFLMCSSPMMTVSAFQNLLKTGYHLSGCKINLILHITLLFFIIYCPFMIFMSSRFRATLKWQNLYKRKIKMKKNTDLMISNLHKKKSLQKSTQINKNEIAEKKLARRMQKYKYKRPYLKSIQYSLNILIPVTVVMRSQIAFFVVISIILFTILILYVRKIKQFKISQRIFQGLIIFIFIVHHICFLFMFLFQKMSQSWQTQVFSVCEVMGIIVIFTVAAGGAVEVIRFLFKFLVQTKIKIRKLCDIAHEKQNEKQQRKKKNNKNNQNHSDDSIPPSYIMAEPNKKKQRTKHLTKQSSRQNNLQQKIAKLKQVEKRMLIKVCVKNSDKNSLYVLYNNKNQRDNFDKSKFNYT